MLSYLLPQDIKILSTPGFIKRQGPLGDCIKKTGNLTFNLITTSEGSRLFVSGASFKEAATALSHLSRLAHGLSQGFRRRLRLVGIGFRASLRESKISSYNGSDSIYTKNYRRKRRSSPFFKNKTNSKLLRLKIGYSHEYAYPFTSNKSSSTDIVVSRLESRSKGTLIYLKSTNQVQLNQVASEIRAFRLPDVYKGKGIYYDREVIKLKKGKRQG